MRYLSTLRAGAAAVAAAIETAIDLRDVHFYGGLLIAAGGGAMLSLPRTLIVLGAVLALTGLRGGR
jgi:hypothetical protein